MGRYTGTNCPPTCIRLVVLGDKNVGKSALVVRFLTKRFIGEYASGTEFTYQKEINMSGGKVMTEICDGVMKKDSQNYLRKLSGTMEACLLVYDVCSRASFDYACQLAKDVKACRLKSSAGESVPLLLVGNKSDLNHFREVKQSEGENFVKSLSMCHFVETSAAESYSVVERVFRLMFQLIRAYTQRTLFPPSGGFTRVGRKNSWSQVAHLIRDHYRKQHALANQHPFATSPERSILNGDESQSFDRNNNSTKPAPSKRRLRKNSTLGFIHTPISLENETLKSRCLSLTKLNENLDSNDVIKPVPRNDSSKMSQSSDETIELSDFSTPDEDAVFSETTNCTLTKSQKCNSLNRFRSQTKNIESSSPARKSSINKKNLKICIYSDNDCEENVSKTDDLPPKSAPIFRSSPGSRFKFFPTGSSDFSESSKTSPLPICSNLNTALTPFPDSSSRVKEEKKSPSHSFLKHFFKGTLQNSFAGRAFGSSQYLHHSNSSPNFDTSMLSVSEFNKNTLFAIDEHGSIHKPKHGVISSRNSSTSLSSMSNDDADLECPNSCSTPSSPTNSKNACCKTRRTSIREAVGGFIRKRKQSITNDCSKQSKERFL